MLSVPYCFGPFSAPYVMLCPASCPDHLIRAIVVPTLSFVASSLDHSDLLHLTWQGMAGWGRAEKEKKVGIGREGRGNCLCQIILLQR